MSTATTEFKVIPVEELKVSKTNPRKHFDEGQLEELTESIREKGIIVPILARPQNGHFEVVAGERRYRAAKKAGLKEIPIQVRDLTDEEALEVQVIENLQRSDVHPLDEAEGYAQLMKKNRLEVPAIAAKVGKSSSYVYQRLKLSELIEPGKKAFWEGNITAGHAILVARLQPEDQTRALRFALRDWEGYDGYFEYHNKLNPERTEEQDEHGDARTVCSVRDLSEFIQKRIHLDLRSAAFDTKDETLLPKAGSCIACPKRTGFNKELFPEIVKGDHCTDAGCFSEKQQALVDRLKAQFKKEKVKFIEVTADQRKPDGHAAAITERSFKKITGKPCKHARVGIYIDGANKGKTIQLCNAKKLCKQHWAEFLHQSTSNRATSSRSSEPRMSYEELERQRKEKEEASEKRFRAVLGEALARVPNKLPKDWGKSIGALVLEQGIGWDLKEHFRKQLSALTPEQRIYLYCQVRGLEVGVDWSGNIHKDTWIFVKRLGVNHEPILQKIADEEKAARKAEKVQTSAKKKSTGRPVKKGGKRR